MAISTAILAPTTEKTATTAQAHSKSSAKSMVRLQSERPTAASRPDAKRLARQVVSQWAVHSPIYVSSCQGQRVPGFFAFARQARPSRMHDQPVLFLLISHYKGQPWQAQKSRQARLHQAPQAKRWGSESSGGFFFLSFCGLGVLYVLTLANDQVHGAGYRVIEGLLASTVSNATVAQVLGRSSTAARQRDAAVATD